MATPVEVSLDSAELKSRIDRFHAVRDAIITQVRQVIVGQEEVIDQILTALVAENSKGSGMRVGGQRAANQLVGAKFFLAPGQSSHIED